MHEVPAAAANRLHAVGGLVRIEQKIDGSASGGMRGHLPAELVRHTGHGEQVLFAHGEHALILRVRVSVDLCMGAVWLTQVCRPDEDAAIDRGFYRTHPEPLVSPSGHERNISDLRGHLLRSPLRSGVIRYIRTHCHAAGGANLLIGAETLGTLQSVAGAGDADPVVSLLHRLDCPDHVVVGQRTALPEPA